MTPENEIEDDEWDGDTSEYEDEDDALFDEYADDLETEDFDEEDDDETDA